MGESEFHLSAPRPLTVMERLKAVVTSPAQCQNTGRSFLTPISQFIFINSMFTFYSQCWIDYKGFAYLKTWTKALQFSFGSQRIPQLLEQWGRHQREPIEVGFLRLVGQHCVVSQFDWPLVGQLSVSLSSVPLRITLSVVLLPAQLHHVSEAPACYHHGQWWRWWW